MRNSSASTEISEPYAEALMSAAQSQNLVEQIGADANAILTTLADSPELLQVLSSPVVESAKKKAILQQVFHNQIHPYTFNILLLLVDRRRISFITTVFEQYQALLRKLNQTVLAEVISAVALSDEQQQAVREKVKALSGAQEVELKIVIDRDLIGGVIINVGSQTVDASLKGQLRRIGLRLSAS